MTDKIYEMLWDCEFCASRKLLGKTHRFCPACGAPQNPEKRYFPPENEKIAVADHEFFGADRICAACKASSSAKVKFCGGCGSPMEGTQSVKLAGDSPPATPTQTAPSKNGSGMKILAAAILVAAVLAVILLRTKPVVLTVSGHSWTREVVIEKFGSVRQSGWCDSIPQNARGVIRSSKERSKKQVEDGQDCRPVKKDRGDGTYAETSECAPRLKEVPIYDDHCEYSTDQWFEARKEKSSGSGLSPEPSWPKFRLAREGECLGCERAASKSESYTVLLKEADRESPCVFKAQAPWSALASGSRWRAEKRVLTGALLCDNLSRAD